jgi:hypothetical protein
MRELMLEHVRWKWRARLEASCMLLAYNDLIRPSQPIHDRREGRKCKERADLWTSSFR